MGVMVVACYRPKPGRADALEALLRAHLPTLRREGLVGDGPALCGRAADGTYVEVFRWRSAGAIDAAHANPAVVALWERFGEVCDFVPVAEIEEAGRPFSPFAPVDLERTTP